MNTIRIIWRLNSWKMLKGIRYTTTSVMILIQSEIFHWLGRDDYNISAPRAVPTQSTEHNMWQTGRLRYESVFFQTSIFNESNWKRGLKLLRLPPQTIFIILLSCYLAGLLGRECREEISPTSYVHGESKQSEEVSDTLGESVISLSDESISTWVWK